MPMKETSDYFLAFAQNPTANHFSSMRIRLTANTQGKNYYR